MLAIPSNSLAPKNRNIEIWTGEKIYQGGREEEKKFEPRKRRTSK